ncbi:class I SAM-dependent methyltransferase [Chengkuizengella axinellae]|uniref:SAM-dependent methyltransferase n=1 Tax=Chengkuizengella axinellae TaxID=3064388 RepID=A0ABT9IUX7_9BACL|nr:SAM-dependent methyltransferase [Chengkuizengella sp. 2205SS18-9]MDP5273138.1 SAM-dependent methyltransferase [Chengkuizengella sp. 2205SS18-9]
MTNLGCMPLVNFIQNQIQSSEFQAISFYEYMSICLYHPEHGYYVKDKNKIGKEGDFYTSSSIGTIMGGTLAKFISRQSKNIEGQEFSLVEWGGGTGRLTKHVLDELYENHKDVYDLIHFISIEESSFHKQLQAENLAEHQAKVQFLTNEEWLNMDCDENVILYSNELLDAFPVHRLIYDQKEIYELFVGWSENEGKFIEKYMKCTNEALLSYVQQEGLSLNQGQRFEINLDAMNWLKKQMKSLESKKFAVIITIDYGDLNNEVYASHRMDGTFMCYYKHLASDKPFDHIGEQDMTSHVNFSTGIRTGESLGFNDWSYMTQKEFLIQNGILDQLQQHDFTDPFHPTAKKNRAIRQLLLSDQMSELFKVLIQKKNYKKG